MQVENFAPFDLAGTNPGGATAKPLDTAALANGAHTVTAQITRAGGGSDSAEGLFFVMNDPLVFTPGEVSVAVPLDGSETAAVTLDTALGTTTVFDLQSDAFVSRSRLHQRDSRLRTRDNQERRTSRLVGLPTWSAARRRAVDRLEGSKTGAPSRSRRFWTQRPID